MDESGIKEKKYCFQVMFDKQWGMPRFIYVVAKNMEEACKYAEEHKNWQQQIEDCKFMGLAP